jgi:hypothetical protein
MRALVLCALAACSMDAHGIVTVQTQPVKAPYDEAFVLLQNPDGSARRVEIDDSGRASGDLVAGGNVALVQAGVIDGNEYRFVQMYTDVAVGAALEFGIQSVDRPPPRTLVVDGSLPAGTNALLFGSACGTWVDTYPVDGLTAQLTDRCGASTDVVVIACNAPPTSTSRTAFFGSCGDKVYQVRYGVPVMNNATIMLDPLAWRAPDVVTVDLSNSERLLFAQLNITSAWGVLGDSTSSEVSQIVAAAPAIGPLGVTGEVGIEGAVRQTIEAYLPAPEHSLDLHGILAPWVIRGTSTWTSDDEDGALSADAQVTSFTSRYNGLVIYSAPSASGNYQLPDLPRALTPFFPYDAELKTTVRLIRFAERFEDPQRTANFLISGGDFRSSYAITSFQ